MRTDYGAPTYMTFAGDFGTKNDGGESAPAKENIYAGRVVAYVGPVNLGFQHPSANKFTLSGSISSGTINLTVEVKTFDENQNEVSTVLPIAQVTYSTNHATTMGLIKAAIETLNPKLTATVDTNSITVTHSDQAVIIITGVTSSQGLTATYYFDGTLVGPTPKAPTEAASNGEVFLKPTSTIYGMTQGIMTVKFVDSVTRQSSLAVQHIANTNAPRGSIRNNTDSGKATAFTALKVRKEAGALSLGWVEINTP
jgi:hypothetical protein